jgi:prolyl-tRNA synthetase
MKGVPLRLEIGPRDMTKDQCVLVRRTDREKQFTPLEGLEAAITEQLETVRKQMFDRALQRRESMTYTAKTLDEMKEIADTKPGLVKAMWCGDAACEAKIKEVAGLSSRCIPFEQEQISDVCPVCGKPAAKMLYWGKAY